MGKSKKRNFSRNMVNKGSVYKRNEAVSAVIADMKNSFITEQTKSYIGLFGITAEELAEAGASIEELSLIQSFL